jgi:MFS family permease
LLSVAFLLMGNGLQGVLLPVRALAEDFSSFEIGLLGTSYFLGFGLGCFFAPHVVRRVGHIRTFAALVSLATGLVLVHGMFVAPAVWWLARMATGCCFAGLYMVIESWLNEKASNENRGLVFSAYTCINLTVIAAGQMMLPLRPVSDFFLFALAAILISVSTLPVAMTTATAPAPIASVHIRLRHLYRLSPVAVIGCFGVGLANGAFWTLGPVFAQRDVTDARAVALFMSAAVLAGALGQWPFGRLSDRMDRRRVIVAAAIGSAAAAVCLILAGRFWPGGLYIAVGLFGAFALPIYALCAAHLNDQVDSEGYVEAASGLNLVFAGGAVLGPMAASAVMRLQGVEGLFIYTASVHAAMAVFAVHRMRQHKVQIAGEKATFGETLLMTQTVAEIDPRSGHDDTSAPTKEAAAGESA